MEKFQELREAAKKKAHIADHMLTQTYPLIKDPKLLLAIIENIFLALSYSMGSILHYERLFKKIPPFQENFSSKFNMFRSRCVEKYNININYIRLLNEVKSIIYQHKKSPVEFSRKDAFVICSESYKMRVISLDEIRNYLNKTKLFIEEATDIVSKNENIFRS